MQIIACTFRTHNSFNYKLKFAIYSLANLYSKILWIGLLSV